MPKVVDIRISDALRDLEARREEHEDPPRVTAEVTDDGEIMLEGTALIPWRVPRPPDAPPPARRSGGFGGSQPDLERRAYVEQLWRSMYASSEIVDIVTTRYGVDERTVAKDISRVRKRYLAASEDPDELRARKEQMRAKLLDLEREARAVGDRSTARYVLDKLAKIDGLYAPTKIEATTTTRVEVGLQIEVIVRHLDAVGLAALETVMLQLEAKGIIKGPELGAGDSGAPVLGPGSVIDAEYSEGEGSDDDDDDDDN